PRRGGRVAGTLKRRRCGPAMVLFGWCFPGCFLACRRRARLACQTVPHAADAARSADPASTPLSTASTAPGSRDLRARGYYECRTSGKTVICVAAKLFACQRQKPAASLLFACQRHDYCLRASGTTTACVPAARPLDWPRPLATTRR